MSTITFYDPRLGPHAWLSNLHPRPLEFEGRVYASAEHAFVSLKARDAATANWLAAAPTPELAAAAGHALPGEDTRPDWAEIQLATMRAVLKAKFNGASDLRERLIGTGTARLVEDSPEDGPIARFWGEWRGEGENWLGRLLADLRAAYAAPME
ncbi:NADAR family protein [Aureimonas endophytica]|nr:NADAR family protein [Aureimonas endophytica]